ncbi:MAG: DNA mismatch repair endonuclease MutL [Bacteroidetes bacterium]|nr:DNA mismatch repair endonuclease MutL [Bacteroidota bacterium]
MADVIQLLPDNIANQIAAGEVVQRPASIVKELLENSVDAGSTHVQLIIKDAGKTLVQVIDNGAGMSETDARMCFERHATSKIKTQDDLYSIRTMGFRGEALASIAAVAQVELKTKRLTDEVGTIVFIENSKVQKQEAASAPEGTSIAVKNLFYNVPARRNFLKSNPVELRHIIDEFLRVAMANPAISFIFYNENEEIYHLKSGTLKQRIVGCFGKKYEEGLVPIEEKTSVLDIHGFIGKPEWARKTRGEQFFFANNRYIKSGYLNHAVSAAFVDLLQDETFPFYAIYLTLPPEKIDINVHPTKTEIKFEDEKSIYAILRVAVKRAINQYHVAPMLNFEAEASIPIAPDRDDWTNKSLKTQSSFAFTQTAPADPLKQRNRVSRDDWKELYEVLNQKDSAQQSVMISNDDEELLDIEPSTQKPVVQVHGKYIISTIRSGMIIINQQQAHERILFEKYMELLDASATYSQKLLFPEVVNVSGQDFEMAKEILPEIKALGFDIDIFGKGSFIISGVPAELLNTDIKQLVDEIIEDYKNNYSVEKLSKRESIARALAINTAVKPGKVLQEEEMRNMIDELFATSTPYFSPGGKPTIITISSDELDKKFKR